MVWYSWYLSRKLHESTGAGLQTEYPIVVLSALLFLIIIQIININVQFCGGHSAVPLVFEPLHSDAYCWRKEVQFF